MFSSDSMTSAAKAGIENRAVYRSGEPLRHPKAKAKSDFLRDV
jgi:hypothetical protein